MIISKLLRELDEQLERLQTARNTIAALIAPPPPKRKASTAPVVASPQTTAKDAVEPDTAQTELAADIVVPRVQAPARQRGRPRGSVNRRPNVPPARVATALSSTVAAGPVFVSAAELERRRNQVTVVARSRPEADDQPSVHAGLEGTLDALIREVNERRSAAAA